MEYSWSLNSGNKINGTPSGNLLFMAENLINDRWYPYTLKINIAQFISGARFQFNKADIVMGTGMTG